MRRIRLGKASEWHNGEGRLVKLVPGTSAYVFRYRDRMRAFVNRCTHMGGPIELEGGQCVCRWHDAAFDPDTGMRIDGSSAPLQSLTILEEGDELMLEWNVPVDPFVL